jgi:hypothetical protein
LQAGGHRFESVQLHQFPDLWRTKANREWVWRRAPSLVLWLFDIVDRMQSTFGLAVHARAMALLSCCVAVGSGSDSARVNEVAKLCRAVVHG